MYKRVIILLLLLLIMGCSGENKFKFTPFEDDHGNYPDDATPVYLGTPVYGELESRDDIDVFAFVAVEGVTYLIETSLVTLNDSMIDLYNFGGNLIAQDDDSGVDNASKLVWTSPASSVFFVAVMAYSTDSTGSYYLRIDCIDCDGDGFREVDGDCNDDEADINPNADEICADGIDQNCDGVDEVCGGDVTQIFQDW